MELTPACRKSFFLIVLFVCLVAGIAMAQQDGGWSCYSSPDFSPQIPVNPTDSIHMVYIFGWLPDSTDSITKMKKLPSWFYSFMDTTSAGWNIKSVPRWYRDMSYDPSLGRSRHIIIGKAYGDSSNTYYFRPDSNARYYSRFNGWYGQFQYDIMRKADQVIDFSQFTGPASTDTFVQECCFFDKDSIRLNNWYYNNGASGVDIIGFGTYVTNDYKNGHHVVVHQGTSLHSLTEWPVPPGWPDQEQRNALGGGVHEYMHHFVNDPYLNHNFDDEGTGECNPAYQLCRDNYPETYAWSPWGAYAPGFGWGFISEADPFMKVKDSWGAPVEVDTIRYRQLIRDYITTGDMFKLPINNPPGNREQYFLVTNHQNISAWEDTFPGKGIVINHVVPVHESWVGEWGNCWEMQKLSNVEAATGLWDSTGAGYVANPDSGWSAPDFYSRDSVFNVNHHGNQGVKADLFNDQLGYSHTIFDGLSNPNSNAYDINYSGWFDEGKYPQNSVTHLAVYNVYRDSTDTTVMDADLLVNNWYGNITQNTTWGPGHYVITGDIKVDSGVTLTIKPGTIIDFYPHVNNQPSIFSEAGIYIGRNGKLKAIGNSDSLIVFRSNASLRGETSSPNDWRMIYLGHGSTDSLMYCQISDCYAGIFADSVSSALIDSNTVSNCQAYGIRLENVRSQTGGLKVRWNTITATDNLEPTYGIYVERTDDAQPTDWKIQGNDIYSCPYGIYVVGDSSSTGGLMLYRNRIGWANTSGCEAGIYLEGTKKAVTIRRNRIFSAIGNAGIQCIGRAWPLIDSTKMASSSGGFKDRRTYYGIYVDAPNSPTATSVAFVTRDSLGKFNSGVWIEDCCSNAPNLGDQSVINPGLSNIVGCKWMCVSRSCTMEQDTMKAEDNWWGSDPPDSTTFSWKVDYDPYLTSEETQSWTCWEGEDFLFGPRGVETGGVVRPLRFELTQSYPNPSTGELTIRYALPQETQVSLRIYNLAGQIVRDLISEREKAGYHSVQWDGMTNAGHSAGSGVYFYRMYAGPFTATKKLVLAR